MNVRVFPALFALFALAAPALAADTSSNPNLEQAREEYRQYLQGLKKLSADYKQITGEMSKVMKEEGFPVFDENTGEIQISHDVAVAASNPAAAQNVQVRDDRMVATLELPGVKKDTLKVRIEDGRWLRVSGKRREDLSGAPVERLVELPEPAGEGDPEAEYEDGVLSVTIPKARTAKNVSVPVH